jgi:sulfite reductase (ferredoxin)
VPHYVLQLGGGVAPQGARLASGDDAIPARRVPGVVRGLLAAFLESPDFPDFRAFVDGEGRDVARQLARAARTVSTDEELGALVVDWGADRPFSLEGRGPGECGAGIFDLIEVDLRSAREALADGRLAETTVQAARALLVTRGHDERQAARAIELFEETFLRAGLVDARFAPILAAVREWSGGPAGGPEPALDRGEVERLLGAVEQLYEDMDDSLRFVPAVEEAAAQDEEPSADAEADRSEDFRGVVCPLNYVKTKMVLSQMVSGAVLSVLLDEAGARNVPESVTRDGYEVLSLAERPGGSKELRIRA